MQDCIYQTDPDWISALRRDTRDVEVNFWRKDLRNMNLQKGAFVYFRRRGDDVIVGRGRYDRLEHMSVREAWNRFGHRNGVASHEDFRAKVKDVLKIEDPDQATIGCMILGDVEWLAETDYFEVTRELFPPGQLSFRYFERSSQPELSRRFSGVEPSPSGAAAVADEPTGHGVMGGLGELADRLMLDRGEVAEIDQLLRDKRQVILYGPPGTGKTFVARELARHYTAQAGLTEVVQFHSPTPMKTSSRGIDPGARAMASSFGPAR